VLEVRVLDVQLRQDWGYTVVRPLAGALPDDIESFEQIHTRIDRDAKVGTLPWGLKLPLRPFFGVMGVSPPKAWGAISSIEPRAHGGNIDNKHMIPGADALPAGLQRGRRLLGGRRPRGAGRWRGVRDRDRDGARGHLRDPRPQGSPLDYPAAETPSHLIAMGMHPDLDVAARDALRRMVERVVRETGLSRNRAFMLMSLVADVHVTQLVNGHKGIHVMLPEDGAAEKKPAHGEKTDGKEAL
jgi:acetamidase/formamidase